MFEYEAVLYKTKVCPGSVAGRTKGTGDQMIALPGSLFAIYSYVIVRKALANRNEGPDAQELAGAVDAICRDQGDSRWLMQQPRNKSTSGGSVKLGTAGGKPGWNSYVKQLFLCFPNLSWSGSFGLKEAVVMRATLGYKSSRQRRSNNQGQLHE